MLGHCFNPQLAGERVQISDWRVLNIACIQFQTSEFHNLFCSFIDDYYLSKFVRF